MPFSALKPRGSFRSLLGARWALRRARRGRQREAGRVDDLGGLEQRLDGRRVKVLLVVAVGGGQVGAERAVATARHEHTAGARGLGLLLVVLHVSY